MSIADKDRVRFLAKVQVSPDPDGCHLWTAATLAEGYGLFWYAKELWLSQRFAYTAAHGPIPTGLTVGSTCRHPGCVRSDHLTLRSRTDNRTVMLSRMRNQMPDAPLTSAECEFIRTWVDLFGRSLEGAKHALGGMHLQTVQKGLRLGREASAAASAF